MGEAEEKLAEIVAYCRKQADEHNRDFGMGVRPEDLLVNAGDILAIIRSGEGEQGSEGEGRRG